MALDDSPSRRGKSSTQISIHDDMLLAVCTDNRSNPSQTEFAMPLTTSKMANRTAQPVDNGFNTVLFKKLEHGSSTDMEDLDHSPMDQLLAKLAEQQGRKYKALVNADEFKPSATKDTETSSSDGSIPFTPATETFETSSLQDRDNSDRGSLKEADPELLRLQEELQAAKSKIAIMDQELAQNRITHHNIDQAIGSSTVGLTTAGAGHLVEPNVAKLSNFSGLPPRPALPALPVFTALPAVSRANVRLPSAPRLEQWTSPQRIRSNNGDTFPTGQFNNPQALWANNNTRTLHLGLNAPIDQSLNEPIGNFAQGASWFNRNAGPGPQNQGMPPPPQQIRLFSGPPTPAFGGIDNRFQTEYNQFHLPQAIRRPNVPNNRVTSSFNPRTATWGSFQTTTGASEINQFQGPQSYQPMPIGTPLSPTAAEFVTPNITEHPWNPTPQPTSPGQTYVSPMEPMNYRRLLDRTVNCNWKYIVDKIVCNNDQQASIFLQQKLKIGTAEQKFEIVEAIVAQAYPLMINRFGNFLVQRCFEHGTPEQVIAIANAIRGNTLNLSMDSFGCHVVQKAFDSVPEDYKAIMVHELLRRIPETVIHRYACHVWQKLFELRWSDSPPQIMKYVNEALRGMWHEVALGETGSLVVQNIFENCLEEDKRPCINEVLASIDIVAHGQFGNWCIQHICEHGLPADRSRAIDHVIRFASEYSMDQFASKVVEKCLKIGGGEFLERYLERVCEGRQDRPRIPLVNSKFSDSLV
ncbi:MAG: hypothetical protein M1829_004086 [Trizodia sp. TS-e1964]|nr:MAG: hypothetical protein M1829_004086 [Trizodia sp. TS-e1964]